MKKLALLFFISLPYYGISQYRFEGQINDSLWHNQVYLSIIEDYRKIDGIYTEQIIARTTTDSLGKFTFTGNELENENRMYRIHVDNCKDQNNNTSHFNGHCNDSKAIVFIAKNNDSIIFPFSMDKQMFCNLKATNPKAAVFTKIDSLKEEMKFDYSQFMSSAKRKISNKSWFKKFHTFGKNLNEPLGELYLYAFLSSRSNNFHTYYLQDLKNSNYYRQLLERLQNKYPNAPYTKQYKSELASDEFLISKTTKESSIWYYLLGIVLTLSVFLNFWLLKKQKQHQNEAPINLQNKLTKQEQNILDLMLQNKTNKEIAKTLFISISTVKTHTNNIYKKTKTTSREDIKKLFIR